MTDQDQKQAQAMLNAAIAQRNQAINLNMTLACHAYLHKFLPVQDLQDEDVKAPEKTAYTSIKQLEQ